MISQSLKGAVVSAIALFAISSADAQGSHDPVPAETSIVAYNLYTDFVGDGWAQRRDVVVDFFNRNRFDIITLQEVTELQIADLLVSLPAYHHVVGDRSDGHRGTHSWYEFTPILYRADRYALVNDGSFSVSETPQVPGVILPDTKDHGRVTTWARLKDKTSGEILLVASTHIHGQLGKRMQQEVEIIAEQLRRIGHEGPVLLAGDFNMPPDSVGYRRLTSGDLGAFTDLRDHAARVEGPLKTAITGRTHHSATEWRELTSNSRIDYIFGCGVEAVKWFGTYPNPVDEAAHIYASDHHAVAARIQPSGKCRF